MTTSQDAVPGAPGDGEDDAPHERPAPTGEQQPPVAQGPSPAGSADDPDGLSPAGSADDPDGPSSAGSADDPDGPSPAGSAHDPDGPSPAGSAHDPDDLAGFEPTLTRVFARLRPILGVVVVLALLVPAVGWAIDRLVVRSAGDAVLESLGGDADIADSLRLVRSVDCLGQSRSGSAFGLEVDGFATVVTNRHVVDNARSTIVQPLDGGPGEQVRAVLLSTTADVAVLVLDPAAVPPPLPVGTAVSLGQSIITVGFPGARPAFREGRVDRIEPARLLLALQVGAGASGSPVLDDEAGVVGQVFARTADGRGVATPVDLLLAAIEDAVPAPGCG